MVKKGWIVAPILLLVLVWILADLYMTTQRDKNLQASTYASYVRTNLNMLIEEVYYYHGEQVYRVFRASDTEGEEYFVFVDPEYTVHQLSVKEISLAMEEVPTVVKAQHRELQEIVRINPAYTERRFAWEVVASDGLQHLHYVYYSMENGGFLKRYTLTQ